MRTAAQPAAFRRHGSALTLRTGGSTVGAWSSSSGGSAITWTSIASSRRRTELIAEPLRTSATRLRRLVPSTSCVARSALANAASEAATSSPTTSWYVPPSWPSRSRW